MNMNINKVIMTTKLYGVSCCHPCRQLVCHCLSHQLCCQLLRQLYTKYFLCTIVYILYGRMMRTVQQLLTHTLYHSSFFYYSWLSYMIVLVSRTKTIVIKMVGMLDDGEMVDCQPPCWICCPVRVHLFSPRIIDTLLLVVYTTYYWVMFLIVLYNMMVLCCVGIDDFVYGWW